MTEKWTRLEPISGLDMRYNIKSIIDNVDGFEIILSDFRASSKDEKDNIKVKFKYGVSAYRCTEEGLTLNLLNLLGEQYGTDFYTKWNFFKVDNSEYIKWLVNEYAGFDDEYANLIGLKHYAFIDNDFILDVIAKYEPDFEFIKKQK